MKKIFIGIMLIAGCAMVASCPGSGGSSTNPAPGGGGLAPITLGPFGPCIAPGTSYGGVIADRSELPASLEPDVTVSNHEEFVVGDVGDYILKNSKAAFIIQKAAWRDSYFPFGGTLVDAVPIENCVQTAFEQFQEFLLIVGKLDLETPDQTNLRAVQANSVTVINDGGNGQAAVVRVTGTEKIFHTLEQNLMGLLLELSPIPALYHSPPLSNYAITVDYILQPDSPVLDIDMTVTNTTAGVVGLMDGAGIFFGDTTPVDHPRMSAFGFQGFEVPLEVPWIVGSNGQSAYATAIPNTTMAGLSVAGLTATLDQTRLPNVPSLGINNPISVGLANVNPGESVTFSHIFTVGKGGPNSAVKNLMSYVPEPFPVTMAGQTITEVPFSGNVYDLATGAPIEGASIELEFLNSAGQWSFMDGLSTDANGDFLGTIVDLRFPSGTIECNDGADNDGDTLVDTGDPGCADAADVSEIDYRMTAIVPGRSSPPSITINPGVDTQVDIPFSPPGSMMYEIRDTGGELIPAKILLFQNGELKYRIYSDTGTGIKSVAPGVYDVSVTRGYEYTTYQSTITVPADNDYYLFVELDHAVDTSGYLSNDVHIHSGRSPDNNISVEERVRSSAATGLEVAVATDHDFIGSWQPQVDALGLNKWMVSIGGTEVTAPLPGHTNMYPIEPWWWKDARGGWLQWMGLGPAEMFAAERARGADVVAVNHPRSSAGFFASLLWNPLTGQHERTDPADLGLPANVSLWSWGFDTFELMNGYQNIFKQSLNPADKDVFWYSGTFEDWMSFINLGELKTADAVSDAHNYTPVGFPRNYYPSATEDTVNFDVNEMTTAMKEGRVVISAGAFARVNVDGTAQPGDTITDVDGIVDVNIHVEAIPEMVVDALKIFVNCNDGGQTVDLNTDGNPTGVVKYDGTVQLDLNTLSPGTDADIVVMGFATNSPYPVGLFDSDDFNPPALPEVPRFVTDPIYIDLDGNGVFDPPGILPCGNGVTYTLPSVP